MAGCRKHFVVATLVATVGVGAGCRLLTELVIDEASHAVARQAQRRGDGAEKPDPESTKSQWIRLWLHRPNGEIRIRQVLAYSKVLDLSNQRLTQVVGLEKLVWLRKLNLSGNRLYSVDVSRLVRLQYLDLSHNSIRRLDGLDKLTELVVLRLGANGIKWIAGLRGLCNAKQINLVNNPLPPLQRQRAKTACPRTKFWF